MTEPLSAAGSPEQSSPPANAEDRKAAAALSALNANEISAQSEDVAGDSARGADGIVGAGGKPPSAADQEALGKAMSQLEIVAGGKTTTAKKKDQQEKEEAAAAAAAAEAKRKRAIKVAAEDVSLLVRAFLSLGFLFPHFNGTWGNTAMRTLSAIDIMLLTGTFVPFSRSTSLISQKSRLQTS